MLLPDGIDANLFDIKVETGAKRMFYFKECT